jgi:hypothetical protein
MLIDNSIVEQARNADMIAFLERRYGFTFAHRGGAYRCEQHKSLAVKADRRSWYWHSKGIGGFGALDFLMKAENMPFREAAETAAGVAPAAPTPPERPAPEQPKTLILPEKRGIPLRLYDYLCVKRGIDGDIVNTLIQKETLYEDRRGNVVFVGHDEHGRARFASLRGTHGDCSFRGDCAGSDKRYGFNMAAQGASGRLYAFESPIDLMSHASMEKAATGAYERHNRLSLAGTGDTALPFFLNRHTAVREIVLCLDNDPAGREAAVQIARKYALRGYIVLNEPPRGKDCNEDLQALKTQIQAERRADTRRKGIDI